MCRDWKIPLADFKIFGLNSLGACNKFPRTFGYQFERNARVETHVFNSVPVLGGRFANSRPAK